MIILGLNFGHDGSAVILDGGKIRGYLLQERFSRVKQAGGLRKAQFDMLLSDAGLEVGDIDFFAISSTQNFEYLVGLLGDLDIRYETLPAHSYPTPLVDLMKRGNHSVADSLKFYLKDVAEKPSGDYWAKLIRHHFPELDDYAAGNIRSVGCFEGAMKPKSWLKYRTFSELSDIPINRDNWHNLRMGFHYPVTVSLGGRDIPGYIIDHQMAHAASAYYISGYDTAAIITHDGMGSGADHNAGMFCLGMGEHILPVAPNHMTLGNYYHSVAGNLGLGVAGAPGRLMGLAPYGAPRFFRQQFVGNWFDMLQRFNKPLNQIWLRHCLDQARSMGADLSSFGKRDAATERINVDIAASTQKVFEETSLESAFVLFSLLSRENLPRSNLCLSGGCALNCPSNTRILREGPFENVFVPPHCADDGLSIGAAMYLYHNVMGHKLDSATVRQNNTPYLGREISVDHIAEAVERDNRFRVAQPDNLARFTASALVENKIVAWFQGRSECGPRALGHRSLLANPTFEGNWQRINKIKERESWRPFAPMVLEEKAGDWFFGGPNPSPYMVFTSQVRSKKIPAITHVDMSSRVQTVSRECGTVYDVIREFYEATDIPVVLNTSLNGPGEPIVETPQQALDFAVTREVDILIIGPYAVTTKA
jgi:carbamoyltransferase